jgi:aspartyl-tRNA(Asn)/glutamyl-tRNA(Gln) amidotransferase subunit C
MSLTEDDVKKIAHLARLNMSESDIHLYTQQLSTILQFVNRMDEIDTSTIQPMANPLDLHQRLRKDTITESNQRDIFQAIAPKVEAGLYLVPKVIDSE